MKTLLVAVCLMVGANYAWGETIASMGNVDEAWTANKHSYTVAANKTLTLNFTVSSIGGNPEDNYGYYVDLKQDGSAKMAVESSGGFYFSAAPDNGWWQWGYQESFDCDWWNADDGYSAFLKGVITGATVELTIQRYGTQVTYYADITTSESERHYLRIISPVNTLDANKDLTVDFGANHAVLTGITDEISDEFTGILIGRGDNHADYNGTNATHQDFTLAADKSLSLNFNNYSSKIGWGDNWYIRITNGTKYFDLRSDYWGGESDGAGYYFRTEETSSPGYFTLTSSTGAYFDGFPTVLHKANVTLTVTRVGKVITISAVQNCTSSVVKTQTYTLTHDDFETGDITVGLYAAWSHLDLLSVSTTIGSTGWTTFASPCALDLSSITASDGTATAYYASAASGSSVTMTSTASTGVAAGQGLALKGTAGATVTIPVAASGTAIDGNKLKGCTTSTALAANSNYYVLVNNNNTAEFQRLDTNGATIPAGKAYLDLIGVSLAPTLSIVFEDETSGIDEVRSQKEGVKGAYYNLAGQRVAQPTKGLYIVNGRKVVIK